jgi:hypothetical protein
MEGLTSEQDPDFASPASRETLQETLEKWLEAPDEAQLYAEIPPRIREAIRALLAENASVSRAAGYLSDLATWWVAKAEQAEAERDACHKVGERIMAAVKPRHSELVAEAVERVVAERDALQVKLREANENVPLLQSQNLELRAEATKYELEVERLEAEVEQLKALGMVQAAKELLARAEKAEAALREWREAESSPDCIACCALDAALAGAKP